VVLADRGEASGQRHTQVIGIDESGISGGRGHFRELSLVKNRYRP
jgi:hypothetical protein